MSYADADRRFYSFPAVNFATGTAQSIQGPKGKAGKLIAIHVAATTTFTATTTAGRVDIGTAATTNAYAAFPLGTLAATDAISSDDLDQTAAIITALGSNIPGDTQVEMTFVAPTGGSPAGVGSVMVIVDWEW